MRASRCRLPLSASGEQTGDRFVLSGSLQSTAPDLKSQPPTTLAHEIRGACSDKKGQNGLKFPIIKLLSLNPKRHNDSFSMRTWWTSQSHVDSRLALLQLTELTKGLLDC